MDVARRPALRRKNGRALTFPALLVDGWGHKAGVSSDPRTVQTHVSSLRRKLGAVVGRRIKSVSGKGYRYD